MDLWMRVAVWSIYMVMMIQSTSCGQDDIMGYWNTRLHNAVMPDGLREFLSPLSPREANQFLVDIGANNKQYLPSSAPTFCEKAHIQCLSPQSKAAEHKPDSSHDACDAKKSIDGSLLNRAITKENNIASRRLTSTNVYEFSNFFFRETQVLRRGVKIHVSSAFDKIGIDHGDRAFLPRKLAKLFPISGDGTQIATMLGLSKDSLKAKLQFCQQKHDDEEGCFSSMEDVTDFVAAIMGRGFSKGIEVYDNIMNASKPMKGGNVFHVQDVTVLKNEDEQHVSCHANIFHVQDATVLKDEDEQDVPCHDLNFPFRVLYCHTTKQSKIFQVTLQDREGSKLNQIIACHYNTRDWSPNHIAFQMLHTKPGDHEVCHFVGTNWMQPDGWVFVPRRT